MRNGASTQFCPEKLGLRCFQGASSSIHPQASQLVLRGTGHSEVGAPGHKVISVSSQPDVSDKTLCHIPEMMPIFSAVSAGCIYTAVESRHLQQSVQWWRSDRFTSPGSGAALLGPMLAEFPECSLLPSVLLHGHQYPGCPTWSCPPLTSKGCALLRIAEARLCIAPLLLFSLISVIIHI